MRKLLLILVLLLVVQTIIDSYFSDLLINKLKVGVEANLLMQQVAQAGFFAMLLFKLCIIAFFLLVVIKTRMFKAGVAILTGIAVLHSALTTYYLYCFFG